MNIHAEAVDSVLDIKRSEAVGQFDLFGGLGDDPADAGGGLTLNIGSEEWEKSQLLAFEREMLGLYVSDHPLFGVEHILQAGADCTIAALTTDEVVDGQTVTIAGLITSIQRKITKQGNAWAIATVEDLAGGVEVMIWPNTFQLVGPMIAEDQVVFIKGKVEKPDEETTRFVANEITVPDLSTSDGGPLVISLPIVRCVPAVIDRLKEVLAVHPGTTEVRLKLVNGSRQTLMRIDDRLRVTTSNALYGDLKALLGASCLG